MEAPPPLTSKQDLLLSRLNAIGASLASSGRALALIGLGSVGIEVSRLDKYSDLDFFAVVQGGHKHEFLNSLSWLSSICPVAYSFRNTPDGYKVLFEDGVFCEFAVFEAPELRTVPFAPGRIVWKREGIPDTLCVPQASRERPEGHAWEWSLGEALTNLYVGLGRHCRGEKLSAMRLIQVCAVDRILELFERAESETFPPPDAFALERRYEQRHPPIAHALPAFTQGYERSVESAKAILSFLEDHFEVNSAMKQAILEMCDARIS